MVCLQAPEAWQILGVHCRSQHLGARVDHSECWHCHADFLTSDNVIASKAETMLETIAHLEVNYGCVRGYAKAIGLSHDEIASIRTNFMKQVPSCESMPVSP